MELAAGMSQRGVGLDLLAAHLAGLDPDTERARDRLERKIGRDLATLLVAALSRSVSIPLARPLAAAAVPAAA
ncbi:MAG: hypothetical protein ACRDNM_10670 [Gaiellaceae bacterium]